MMPKVADTYSFKSVVHHFVAVLPQSLQCVIGIDPGETTGIAVFKDAVLTNAVQIDHRAHKNIAIATSDIVHFLRIHKPAVVVIEDYRVYHWKTKMHAHSDLFTPRLIGSLEYGCNEEHYAITKQMAQVAKRFMTDAKLRSWDFWLPGKRHSRDAIRHAAYYILLNAQKCHQRKNDENN